MNIKTTSRFDRKYKKLSPEMKDAYKSQIKHFLRHPRFPFHESLRIKGIKGRRGIFEMTVTMSIRATWQYKDGGVIFRNIGDHDEVLKNP